MKKFTVKDLIKYVNPCICGNKVNLYFRTSLNGTMFYQDPAHISPTISNDYVSVELRITYNHSLELIIYHKTNKFVSNNMHELESYLSKYTLNIISYCYGCSSMIISDKINFNIEKQFVLPISIFSEDINMKNDSGYYRLQTNVPENTTIISGHSSGKTPWNFVSEALPLYKFKNKEQLIKKIKTYLLFL